MVCIHLKCICLYWWDGKLWYKQHAWQFGNSFTEQGKIRIFTEIPEELTSSSRLGVKATTCKAKAKDLTFEAKAKDLTFKAKAKANDLIPEHYIYIVQ